MKNLLYILILFTCLPGFSQEERKYIRKGNDHYEKQEFDKADEQYKKALQLNSKSEKADFNLGDALFKQKKYAEAIQQFQKIAESTKDNDLKAKAFHNMGNSYLESQKYQESVDAYKKSLRLNPKDDETRYNLSYALKKLQQQQDQEKKDDQNKDKDKDKDQENKDKDQNKDENKDKNEDQNKDKNEQNQDKNQNKDDKKEDQQQDQQQQQQPNQLSKEDAQRMLDALNNKEKNVQAKLKKKKLKGEKVTVEKDW